MGPAGLNWCPAQRSSARCPVLEEGTSQGRPNTCCRPLQTAQGVTCQEPTLSSHTLKETKLEVRL